MDNQTLLQYFQWYLPEDGGHWRRAAGDAAHLRALGFTGVWLPPAYKGANGEKDVGYGVYDLYDLGEFDQKGTVATKYGTREEYLGAVRALQGEGLQVLADVVLNHRMGADGCEQVPAERYSDQDRSREMGGGEQITAWTKFTFPGRGGKYSDFTWNWTHFDGTDWDESRKERGVFAFQGKQWDSEVDTERGNYDYLMGADLDMSNPQVEEELTRWGRWYLDTTHVDGFRLDAVKHIRFSFYLRWLKEMREHAGRPLFTVGEYWSPELRALTNYLDKTGDSMSLFDVPLHFNLCRASGGGGNYDLRNLFQGTLADARPARAVTFVDNHDTQPGQALQSWVQGWFKPLAYSLILLRQEGIPCVFYGDLYGIPHDRVDPVGPQLEKLLLARRDRAYGEQLDYFDHPDLLGWTRLGDGEHPNSGLAVVLTDGPGGSKTMCVGAGKVGKTFVDLLGNRPEQIVIAENGCAQFPVSGGSVSVWGERAETLGPVGE